MDREIETLLKIVKEQNPVIPLTDIDITRLVRLSLRHKVMYHLLLFAQSHREAFSDEQISKLTERNHRVARQSLTQLNEMKKIADRLNEQGISYVCIKGPQLSRMIYGREALKESVDIDIMLVNAGDLQKVHDYLNNLGYSQSNLNDYPGRWRRRIFLIAKREVHYHNPENKCSVDLHIRPGANTYLTEKYFKGFLSDLRSFDLEGTTLSILNDEAYFVYLCYHGALHQFMRLAWLLDIRAFLQQKEKTLDWDRVTVIARTLNVERSVALALLLLEQYFGDHFASRMNFNFHSSRLLQLTSICNKSMTSKPGYPLSFMGRFDKVMFIMKLIKGLPGKIDWLYGIFMRQLIRIL